ncbi:MAG: hypothetical protein ACE5PM_03430 [Candidatus Hydrothermarchaeales archaeon]
MGVHLVKSKAAKAYAARERVLGMGISILGTASERAASLDKELAEKCGDIAAELVPHSPGYAGKLMQVSARLFWALAKVEEKKAEFVSIEELGEEIEKIKEALE